MITILLQVSIHLTNHLSTLVAIMILIIEIHTNQLIQVVSVLLYVHIKYNKYVYIM